MVVCIIMVKLPLVKRLRKQAHRDVAAAQDILVNEICSCFERAVIHGGTAIWRCYNGSRFSEDIDIYLPSRFRESDGIRKFVNNLKSGGAVVEKFREKENSIYARFRFGIISVGFESVFEDIPDFIVKPFELSDGTFINVNTLSPEQFISEKASAYLSRKKVRDLYDIYFLLNFAEDRGAVSAVLRNLVQNFKEPVDTEDLKALVIVGAIPRVNDMLEAIRIWAK